MLSLWANWLQLNSQLNSPGVSFWLYRKSTLAIPDTAVVCRLFRKPVNLLKKTVGYRLTFIQSSDLHFLSIHAILLEVDHQCVHM